jgi:hypothetical protein
MLGKNRLPFCEVGKKAGESGGHALPTWESGAIGIYVLGPGAMLRQIGSNFWTP